MATTPTDTDQRYPLGSSDAEIERLLAQTRIYEREARWLFADVAPVPGGRAVDIGCGALGVLPLLAAHVGDTGSVVGVDADARMLQRAGEECAAVGVHDVEFVQADAATTGLPRASFDLVHIRLLLVNIAHPVAVLQEAARLVKPGGVVLIQEFDLDSWRCEPGSTAFAVLRELLVRMWQSRGFDPFIGRRLPRMLTALGLRDVESRGFAGLDTAADRYGRLLTEVARRVAPQVVELGLCDADRFDALIRETEAHIADAGTVVTRPLLVQARALRPV